MTRNNSPKFNNIKYKDLAIAVALSGASLLLFPSTTKAATNEDSPTDPTTSTLVQQNNEATDPAITSDISTGSITPSISTQNIVNNTTSSTDTSTSETSDTTSSLSTTSTTNNNTDAVNDTQVNTPISSTNETSTTSTQNQTTTQKYTLDDNGNIIPAYQIPESGISIQNEPNSEPSSTGTYSVSIQAVTNDGKPIGNSTVIANSAPNSNVVINWTTAMTNTLIQTMGTNTAYSHAPWNPDYTNTPLTVPVTNSNVLVSVYFEIPSIYIHYVYWDETANKEIAGETRPYYFENNSTIKNTGIVGPMDLLTNSGLVADDSSEYGVTNTAELPYFGPTGMIFDDSHYVLDLSKSSDITPLDAVQYPESPSQLTETFYYNETNSPTVTVDAVDQFGNTLKTFSNSTISPSATSFTDSEFLPAASDTDIANETLSSINVIESQSVSGQANKITTYQMTPTQYATFLNSTDATDQNDVRLLGDYSHLEIQLGYTEKAVQLYIQPVDPNGNNVGAPIAVGSGYVGQNATIFAPSVAGYNPIEPSVEITVQPDQGPINFPYISATDINPNDGGTYLYSGKFSSIPTSGIQITNTGTVTTDSTAEHSVSIQAVDTDGDPLGALIPVTSAESNTTASIDWSPSLINLLNSSVKNVSQYELWNASALTGSTDVPVTTQDVVVDVIYALPKVTTTYNYVDENTGKNLLTQTNTWDLDDPNNGYTFKTQGIRPPMTIIDPDSGQLVADDLSPTPQTDPADLPFFGPSGTVFNTGQYQLNSLMSGLTTPTRYITWPSANVTKTFYYMENPDPTITLDAINQAGNVIKTFNAPTVVSTLPAPQLSPAADFPTVAQATINGYTLTGIQVHATGSYFGGTDTDYSYNLTPDQYADFISSPSAQSTMDERALAAHSNFGINFTYVGDQKDLMVQPVDENGVKIGEPISAGTGIVGSSATLTAPEIANYQAISPTSTITVDPDQGTVEIPYTRMATTDPDTGNTGSGSSTDPDAGNTGSGSSTDPDTGNTGSGSTTDPDTGNTGSGSTTDPDTGNTGSGSTTDPDTGNAGSGSSTDPDTGNAGSGSSTDPDTGDTGSGSTTDPDTGDTGSGSTTDPDTSDTGSGSITDSNSSNTGTTTDPDTNSTGPSSNTGEPNTSDSVVTDPNLGGIDSGTSNDLNSGSSSFESITGSNISNANSDNSVSSNLAAKNEIGSSSNAINSDNSSKFGTPNNVSTAGTLKNISNTKTIHQVNAEKSQLTRATTNTKLPQTSNKLALALSAAGIAILGIMGLCIKKIKKLI